MALWFALVAFGLGLAVVVTILRKVPDPNQEFMMDLYYQVLGQETEQFHAPSVECARPDDRVRRAA